MLVIFNSSIDFFDYAHGAVFPVVFDVRRILFAGLKDGDVTLLLELATKATKII